MKRFRLLLLVPVGVLLLSGCIFVNVKIPFDTDLDNTTLGQKKGEAHTYSVLWLVAWGDSGTAAAAENGGITIIRHMDAKVFSILFGLYSKTTTIVYGD